MQLELLSLDRITVKTDQRIGARNRKKGNVFENYHITGVQIKYRLPSKVFFSFQTGTNNMREYELLAHFIKILSRSFFLHSSEISASEKYCQMALSLKNANNNKYLGLSR